MDGEQEIDQDMVITEYWLWAELVVGAQSQSATLQFSFNAHKLHTDLSPNRTTLLLLLRPALHQQPTAQ